MFVSLVRAAEIADEDARVAGLRREVRLRAAPREYGAHTHPVCSVCDCRFCQRKSDSWLLGWRSFAWSFPGAQPDCVLPGDLGYKGSGYGRYVSEVGQLFSSFVVFTLEVKLSVYDDPHVHRLNCREESGYLGFACSVSSWVVKPLPGRE